MRKTILLMVLVVMNSFVVFGQAPNWSWAKSIGGPGTEHGIEIATDKQGNSYITGYFSGSADFGCTVLTTGLAYPNCFIAKVDSQGFCLWAKQGGGLGFDYGNDIAVDDSGNVYVTGDFVGPANFDSISLSSISNGARKYFLAKYDSAGNVKWVKYDTALGWNKGNAICIDPMGNIIIAGYYAGTAVFDSLVLGLNSGNIFIAKFASNGKCLAAHGYYGQLATDIKIDQFNNTYLSGKFLGTAIFGADTLISHGDADGFIIKLDSTLSNVIWAKQTGGGFEDYITKFAIDSNENVFLLGDFKDTAFFDTHQFISAGNFDGFLIKCNANGNLVWFKTYSAPDISNSKDIELDKKGNIYISQDFRTSLTINSNNVLTNGYTDLCVFKLDTVGATIWIKTAGTSGDDYIDGLEIDGNNNLLATGAYSYSGTISFDGINLTPSNNGSAFVAKIDFPIPLNIFQLSNSSMNLTLCPNPTTSQLNISSPYPIDKIEITNVLGELIYSATPSRSTAGKNCVADIKQQGIYFVSVVAGEERVVRKVVVAR